ncbi:MAG: hypothetical protein V1820_04855, partial [archaeon]
MVKLADKYPVKLSAGAPVLLKDALKQAGIPEGKLLAANGSWHFVVVDGKETAKTSDFEFLCLDGKRPLQANLSFEDGKWTSERKDLTKELGEMPDEAKLLEQFEKKLVPEAKILEIAEKALSEARKSAPHLRMKLISFSVSDENYEIPAWRIEAGNWPIISYLKSREKEKQAVLIIDALK